MVTDRSVFYRSLWPACDLFKEGLLNNISKAIEGVCHGRVSYLEERLKEQSLSYMVYLGLAISCLQKIAVSQLKKLSLYGRHKDTECAEGAKERKHRPLSLARCLTTFSAVSLKLTEQKSVSLQNMLPESVHRSSEEDRR